MFGKKDVRPYLQAMAFALLIARTLFCDLIGSIGDLITECEASSWLIRAGGWRRNSSNQSGKHSSDDERLHDVLKEYVALEGDEGKVVVFCQEPGGLQSRILISRGESKTAQILL